MILLVNNFLISVTGIRYSKALANAMQNPKDAIKLYRSETIPEMGINKFKAYKMLNKKNIHEKINILFL